MSTIDHQFMSHLNPSQEELLTAALNANSTTSHPSAQSFGTNTIATDQFSFHGLDPSLFMNQNSLALDNFNQNVSPAQQSPFLDFADEDGQFDYDFNDLEGEMVGDLLADGDLHDKRKSLDDRDDNENAGKRREGDNKEPKKPGRKPLTAEPTNKRKAQNRAAQRAFRERKEKHLKDLETKVEELEKESEATSQENSLLKAQVSRLQLELREYRKRLTMGGSGMLGRQPPLAHMSPMNFSSDTLGQASNLFTFDFPHFDSKSNSVASSNEATQGLKTKRTHSSDVQQIGGRGISAQALPRTNGSISSTISPRHQNSTSSVASTSDQFTINGDGLSAAFSPIGVSGTGASSTLADNWITTTTSAEPETTKTTLPTNSSRIFQFNANSSSSNSPGSISSVSQYGANSSCGTSPEPTHNSPKNTTLNTITECHVIQTIDGATPIESSQVGPHKNAQPPVGNLASQRGGGWDPLLFDGSRDSTTALLGDGDFTGGFFNDALPSSNLTNTFDWADITAPTLLLPTGLTPALQKRNPMELADALQNGEEEEVVPADSGPLLNCHKIWDKLQDRQDFKDGSLDIDGLCSELRAKARCSESGAVVNQADVDEALKRLSP